MDPIGQEHTSNSCRDIAFTAYFKWNIYAVKIISVYTFSMYFLHPGHATLIVVMKLGCFHDPSIQWLVLPLAGLTTQAGKKVSKVTNKQTKRYEVNTITGVPVAYIMEQNQMLYRNRNLPNISTGLRPSWPYTKRGGVDYRTTKHKSIQIWTQDLCEGRKQACKEYFRPESLRVLIG